MKLDVHARNEELAKVFWSVHRIGIDSVRIGRFVRPFTPISMIASPGYKISQWRNSRAIKPTFPVSSGVTRQAVRGELQIVRDALIQAGLNKLSGLHGRP